MEAALILAVDNSKLICSIFYDELTSQGFEVDFVHSGEEALDNLSQKEYRIIFTDIVLPGWME